MRFSRTLPGFWCERGQPELFSWQWDLGEIRDLEGNWIKLKYSKRNGDVKYCGWTPTNDKYTKESYVKEITSNNGTKIVFANESKSTNEYYEPNTGISDGKETNQPLYDTRYLSQITISNNFLSLPYTQKIFLYYGKLNNANFTKRLLTSITSENGKTDNGTKGKIATIFSYYMTVADPTGCFGALRSVKTNSGGETIWEYEKKEMSHVTRKKTFPYQFTNYVPRIEAGITNDGEDYYTIEYENDCHVYKWNGTKWDIHTITIGNTLYDVYNGPNYFVVTTGSALSENGLKVIFWNGENWEEEFSITDLGAIEEVYTNKKIFLVKTSTKLFSFGRYEFSAGVKWIENSIPVSTNDYNNIIVGNNYCVFYPEAPKTSDHYWYTIWNGQTWSELIRIRPWEGHNGIVKVLGSSEMFMEEYEPKDRYYYPRKFSGLGYECRVAYDGNSDRIPDGSEPIVSFGNNFFIFNSSGITFNWDGHTWRHSKNFSGVFLVDLIYYSLFFTIFIVFSLLIISSVFLLKFYLTKYTFFFLKLLVLVSPFIMFITHCSFNIKPVIIISKPDFIYV